VTQKPSDPTPAVIGVFNSELAASVRDSAQQIWLAGMGAFAKAQEEGTKVFDSLVKEGVGLQRRTQSVAEERLNEAAGRMTTMATEVTSKAGASWDKLENIFEGRTAKALGRLGVPTAAEVAALTRRVDALAAMVARLSEATQDARDSRESQHADAAPAVPAVRKAAPRKAVVPSKAAAPRKAAAAKKKASTPRQPR
jgi:poly(hydroxyalkanoate) granule-associated protein